MKRSRSLRKQFLTTGRNGVVRQNVVFDEAVSIIPSLLGFANTKGLVSHLREGRDCKAREVTGDRFFAVARFALARSLRIEVKERTKRR
jgi:hypothetical protein